MFLPQDMFSRDNRIKQNFGEKNLQSFQTLFHCPSIVSEQLFWIINQFWPIESLPDEIPKIAPNNASVPCFRLCLLPVFVPLAWAEKILQILCNSALELSLPSGPKSYQTETSRSLGQNLFWWNFPNGKG